MMITVATMIKPPTATTTAVTIYLDVPKMFQNKHFNNTVTKCSFDDILFITSHTRGKNTSSFYL